MQVKQIERHKVSEFLAMMPEVEKKDSSVLRILIHLTEEDRKNLSVSEDELKKMKPDELTDRQWNVISRLIDETARRLYTRKFKDLYAGEQIDVLKHVISLKSKKEDSKGKQEECEGLCLEYTPSKQPHKAAETLSSLKGDCDDLSLLYIACVKHLENEGKINIDRIKLAVADYYDPQKKEVVGHANVLQISMKTKSEKNPKTTTYLVDLTQRRTKDDLHLAPEFVSSENSNLKSKFVDYLNGRRHKSERIIPEFTELLFYDGYAGAQVYYYQANGNLLLNEGKYQEAVENFSTAIRVANENNLYCGDALFDRAKAYQAIRDDVISENKKLFMDGKSDEAEEKGLLAKELYDKIKEDCEEGVRVARSSYALNEAAKYLSNKKDYAAAENMVIKAIEIAPFELEVYETYWKAMKNQAKIKEAYEKLTIFKGKLNELNKDEYGPIADVKKMIEKLLNEAEKYYEIY